MRASEFVTEKWSAKYKRSIDCSHPKGFSQRAHCAGRKKHNESTETDVAFEIDSEPAYNAVLDKFGSVIEWSGDYMVAPRMYWSAIQELAYDNGGDATEVGSEQLDELQFKGSQCTKDCSGHRAGYEWSQRHGGAEAASWSPSFNKGAWLNNNGF